MTPHALVMAEVPAGVEARRSRTRRLRGRRRTGGYPRRPRSRSGRLRGNAGRRRRSRPGWRRGGGHGRRVVRGGRGDHDDRLRLRVRRGDDAAEKHHCSQPRSRRRSEARVTTGPPYKASVTSETDSASIARRYSSSPRSSRVKVAGGWARRVVGVTGDVGVVNRLAGCAVDGRHIGPTSQPPEAAEDATSCALLARPAMPRNATK